MSADQYALIPDDVREWVSETYTDEGVDIWLAAWVMADQPKRARMVQAARGDGMGS